MKHNIKVTVILIAMFIVTQLIGLWVVNHYLQDGNGLPYGMDPPEVTEQTALGLVISLIISFTIAVLLIVLLVNFKNVWVMRIWFFLVVILALGITLSAILISLKLFSYNVKLLLWQVPLAWLVALAIGIIIAYIKVFRRNILVHNLSELFIYPGIAAVFVPILNIWTIIALLIIISIYDIWAVWHSGIMQKMAKFQMDKVKVFGGFFVPYADKKTKQKIKLLKLKYKNKSDKALDNAAKKQKIKVNLAILGGGDVIFPIIAAGVFLKTFNNIWATLAVTLGASIALLYLFLFAKKKKFYPAMPYITTGIFIGMLVGWLITLI